MAVKTYRVMVQETPTRLGLTEGYEGGDGLPGSSILLRNVSGVTIYLGGDDVAVDSGVPIYDKELIGSDVFVNDSYYAVAPVADSELRVMQVGV